MLLTITTTCAPATDLEYLLHKNPTRHQRLAFDDVHIFYPEATTERCTAAHQPDPELPYRNGRLKA